MQSQIRVIKRSRIYNICLLTNTKRVTNPPLTLTHPELVTKGKNHRPLSTTSNMMSSSPTTAVARLNSIERPPSASPSAAKPYRAMPGPRGIYGLPYLGFLFHTKPFGKYSLTTIDKLFLDMHARYGPVFKIQTNSPSVVVTDPKDISTVLQNQGKYPVRPNFDIYDVYYRRSGAKHNIGVLQGEEWRKLREPMQRAVLKPKNISRYFHLMEGVADDFVKLLSAGYLKNHDMDKAFMAYSGESTGTLFFNKRMGMLDENPSQVSKDLLKITVDLFETLFESVFSMSIAYKFYRSKDYLRFEAAQLKTHEIVFAHVLGARKELDTLGVANVEDSITMSLLKEGISLEDTSLILEALFLGSIDTSASGLAGVLHALAANPDKQEKVREDIFSVLGDDINTSNNNNNTNRQHITKELLDKMRYLGAFVKEVHRYSVLVPIGIIRRLPVDVVLSGYTVPAGVQIYTTHQLASRDETIFENPEVFEPKRWLRTTSTTTTHHDVNTATTTAAVAASTSTFIPQAGTKDNNNNNDALEYEKLRRNWAVVPFGLGPRSCPGKRIFEHEIGLLVVKLLCTMRVGLEPGSEKVKFEYRPFLKATKSIPFTFTPLDKTL